MLGCLLVLGAAWRLWLMVRFYGWEESDYGNLAMARGVLSSGFTRFDMNHLPLYYGLSALVLAVTGDAVVATRAVSLLGGLAALGLAVYMAQRLAGRQAGWIVGIILIFQPEFALYSASSLREPLYAALLLASVALLGREALARAACLAGAAFLVRFDALLILGPLLLLHALTRAPRPRRVLAVFAPLAGTVSLWSLYCQIVHGTWRFWEHSVSVNIETGLGEEAGTLAGWIGNGLQVSAALLVDVLGGHLGHAVLLAGGLGLVLLARSGHGLGRAVALLALLATGFWLAIGFVGQHDPGHNLYWKWMLPLVPLWAIGAACLLVRAQGRLQRWMGPIASWTVLAVVLATVLGTQLGETKRQLELSRQLYKPQLELALRVEHEIPVSTNMVLDNIPACWLNRDLHERRLWSWMDIPRPASASAFGDWLISEEIAYVLWFQEEWTQAPVVAPWLATGGRVRLGRVQLQELEREDSYGWIWYRVD